MLNHCWCVEPVVRQRLWPYSRTKIDIKQRKDGCVTVFPSLTGSELDEAAEESGNEEGSDDATEAADAADDAVA